MITSVVQPCEGGVIFFLPTLRIGLNEHTLSRLRRVSQPLAFSQQINN